MVSTADRKDELDEILGFQGQGRRIKAHNAPFMVEKYSSDEGVAILRLRPEAKPERRKILEVILREFNAHADIMAKSAEVAVDRIAEGLQAAIGKQMSSEGRISPEVRRALSRVRMNSTLIDRTPMATQIEAAELLGKRPETAPVVLARLEKQGRIFRVKTAEGIRYPLFQFNLDAYEPYRVIGRILELRPDGMLSMELLRFFMTTNAELVDIGVGREVSADESRPASLIGKSDDRLVDMFRAFLRVPVEG